MTPVSHRPAYHSFRRISSSRIAGTIRQHRPDPRLPDDADGRAGRLGRQHPGAERVFQERCRPTAAWCSWSSCTCRPTHESTLAELLAALTTMPVLQAQDGQKVEANHVYVIPPGKHLTTVNGHLRLTDLRRRARQARGGRPVLPLAGRHARPARRRRSCCPAPTATARIGIKRIKERGGLTIAQDPDEAEHAGMPRAAIDTGMVDWVLPVAEMPARLLEYYTTWSAAEAAAGGGPAAGAGPRPTRRRRRGGAARRARLPAHAAPAATSPTTSGPRSCAASPGACRSTASTTCPATWTSCARIPAKPARCCRTC